MNPIHTFENVLLAKDFMQFINDTYAKRLKRFQFQLEKHRCTDNQGAEDVFVDTILKCNDRILREGLPEGKAFGAYFDRATENNLVQHLIKAKNDGAKLTSFGAPIKSLTTNRHTSFNDDFMTDYDNDFEPSGMENPMENWDIVELPDPTQVRQQLVQRLFLELPEKYREVLMMVSDGLRYREIQRSLNLTKGQVKMRILTARRLMAEKLEAAAYPEDASDFLNHDDEGSDY